MHVGPISANNGAQPIGPRAMHGPPACRGVQGYCGRMRREHFQARASATTEYVVDGDLHQPATDSQASCLGCDKQSANPGQLARVAVMGPRTDLVEKIRSRESARWSCMADMSNGLTSQLGCPGPDRVSSMEEVLDRDRQGIPEWIPGLGLLRQQGRL